MRPALALPGALLLALHSLACTTDVSLPREVRARCHPGGACPPGTVCRELVGRCVEPVHGDSVPPAVVEATTRVEPALLGSARTLQVWLEATEPLALPPEVTLELPEPVVLRASAEVGRWLSAAYLPTGQEPQGTPVTLTARLVDTSGNEARGIALGSVRFDFSAPEPSSPRVPGPRRLGPAGIGQVEVTVEEVLPQPPRVSVAGSGIPAAFDPRSPVPTYRYSWTVGIGATEGPIDLSVVAVDGAGNQGRSFLREAFVLDFTPPALAAPPTVTPAAARPGATVAVMVVVDEPLALAPGVGLHPAGRGPPIPLRLGQQVGSTYQYAVQAPAERDGVYDLRVEGARDLAGNPLARHIVPGAVRIDSVAPVLVAGPTLDKDPPHYRRGETIEVRFAASEDLGERLPSVTLDTKQALDLPCRRGEGAEHVCALPAPLTGDERPEGPVRLLLVLEDAAGNSSFTSTSLALDFEAPRLAGTALLERCDRRALASSAPDDLWMRTGLVCPGPQALPVQVTFDVTEPVRPDPPPEVTVGGSPLTLVQRAAEGTRLVYGYLPTGAEEETDSEDPASPGRPVGARVADLAGNEATLELGTLRFDSVAPRLDSRALSAISHVRNPWGSEESGGRPRTSVRIGTNVLGEPGEVRVWSVPAAGGGEADVAPLLLGTGAYAPGQESEVDAGPSDVGVVAVSFVDRSGNESDADPDRAGCQPAPLRRLEWLATLSGKVAREEVPNPHRLLQDATAGTEPAYLDRWTQEVQGQASYAGAGRLADDLAVELTSAVTPWTIRSRTTTGPRTIGSASAFDHRRGRLVVFGGKLRSREFLGDTFEWDGRGWIERAPHSAPAPRLGHVLAYDTRRARVLLFGGATGGSPDGDAPYSDATWEWDGHDWVRRFPHTSPPALLEAAAVYDAARGATLVFGGAVVSAGEIECQSALWEWDGTDWRERQAAPAPDPRRTHALAWDAERERVVLFGGEDCRGATLDDTWEWDGERWHRQDPQERPAARSYPAMVGEPGTGRVLLFGGYDAPEPGACGIPGDMRCGDTWSWDGQRWQEVASPEPEAVGSQTLWYADGRSRMQVVSHDYDRSVWELRGADWHRLEPAEPLALRQKAAAAYDAGRERLVLFGGYAETPGACGDDGSRLCADTWEWDGDEWRQRDPAAVPPPRYGHTLVQDPRRGVVVLYGGCGTVHAPTDVPSCRLPLADTWAWDGSTWQALGPGPPMRLGAPSAWDRAREVVVLFGGVGLSPEGLHLLGDTWEWNGATWIRAAPRQVPPRRDEHSLAWDPVRERVLLFGGHGGAVGELDDTWEWDGEDWNELLPATPPPPRAGHRLASDWRRGRVVLFGGLSLRGGVLPGTWEWDGEDWTQTAPLRLAPARMAHALSYDPARAEVVLVGGDAWYPGACDAAAPSSHCRQTWSYAPAHTVPHLVAEWDLTPARHDPADRSERALLAIDLRARAGGLGHAFDPAGGPGPPVPGWSVSLGLPGRGGWVRLHEDAAATPDAPSDWRATFTPDWRCGEPRCEDARLDDWDAAGGKLLLDLAPLAPQGDSPDRAVISVDYLEVRLHQWRTGCESPTDAHPEGTPDGTPCDDGDPSTDGERCVSFRCTAP